MRKTEIDQILKTNKVPVWDGYWTDNLLGMVWFFILPVTYLFAAPDKFVDTPLPFQVLLITSTLTGFLMIYGYLTERRLSHIVTGLPAIENRIVVKKALDSLNWGYKEYANYIEFSDNKSKFIQRFVLCKIIPFENGVGYNMMYYGSYKGRSPYFFGIKTYLMYRLKRAIINQIRAKDDQEATNY